MASTPEKKVKEVIKKQLDSIGAYWVMPATGGYGRSGVPDFIVCFRGRFIGIEAKAGGGKTTKLQDKHLMEIGEAGGIAWVVDEDNMAGVGAALMAGIKES